MMHNPYQSGQQAENIALEYLNRHNLRLVQKNFHSRFGEIDLIMRERSSLVFVEVRARASRSFGGAAASVSQDKQQKLIKTATNYLLSKNSYDKQPIRFDVVAIEGVELQIEWIKNAFGLDF